MIKTTHKKTYQYFFDIYLRRLFKKNFYSMHMFGEPPKISDLYHLIITPNHSSWWDGFFTYYLNKIAFGRKFYLMMLESQLTKFNFFSKIGAYSIDPDSPKKIMESLNYSVDILNENHKPITVNIYPQGELLPNITRPIIFKKGLDKIIQNYGKKLNIMPLAIRIEFLNEQRPQAFFKFGRNLTIDCYNFPGVKTFAEETERLLDEINAEIIAGNRGQIIFSGKESIHDTTDKFFSQFKKDQPND